MLAGNGLTGQYFHNENFTGLAVERIEAVNFNWGSASPASGLDADTYSVRWTGQIQAQYSQSYTFFVTSNQGVRMWIDGQLLIDNWTPHNSETDSASIDLFAGELRDIRIDYYEQYGAAEIKLEWLSASQPRQVVPSSQLYVSPEGLRGEYADSFGGKGVRIDPIIDFSWGSGRPHPSVAVDQFNVKWSGMIRSDYAEEYSFAIHSDEGVRLWIGNELVIDDWTAHTLRRSEGVKTLEAGKWYDIRVEYFDRTGNAEVELKWSSPRQTGAGAYDVIPSSHLRAAQRTAAQFTNPLGPGADPYAMFWEGQYYMVNTTGGNVRMERAERLEDIHISTPESDSTVVWTPPGGTNYSEQVWAPELFRLNGKWYIYVTASNGANATHRMYVLERDDPNPMGPFMFKGMLNTGGWAIDGTVLSWQDQLYFIWSGWPGANDGQQNLYIAPMSDPLTISGSRTLLSSPTYAWEQHGMPINEGPQVLTSNGNLHIIYSASGYWSHNYALGRLTYNGVGPITSSSSWQKASLPVFQQAGDIVGTGHASFTTSPDGTENWIVYHAHHDPDNWQDDRDIYIQRFTYRSDGTPDFGTPIPATTRLNVPSGPADPERPFLAGDFDADNAVGSLDLSVWKSLFGYSIIPGTSADSDGNGLVDGADFLAWQRRYASTPLVDATTAYWRHENGTAGTLVAAGANAVVDASGHGNHMRTFNPTSTGASYVSDVSPLTLRSGLTNSLSLDFGPGGDGPGQNDDNYADGKPLNSKSFTALTVEFAFKMNSIGGFQTLVGKDGKPTSSPVAPLQIKVRGDSFPDGVANQLFVEWIDGDGDVHHLASGVAIAAGNWNHVAFVLTANRAALYLMGESGDYQLVDAINSADFAGADSQVLVDSTGNFTVGRGMYNGNAADWSNARIDEVRISDRALEVTDFLFAEREAFTAALFEVDDDVPDSSQPEIPLFALTIPPFNASHFATREIQHALDEKVYASECTTPPLKPNLAVGALLRRPFEVEYYWGQRVEDASSPANDALSFAFAWETV